MTQVISPTPGRIVWYYPSEFDGIGQLNGHPLAAIVTGIHNDNLVNLAVFDAYGNSQSRSSVHLVQPGEDRVNSAHATWMPYQVGQAEKTKAVADAAIDALTIGTGIVQTSIAPNAMFAETNGTSASETGLVTDAAPSSTEPAPAGDAGDNNEAAAA